MPTYKPGENPNSLKNLLPRPPAGAARKGAYAANKAKNRKRQMREAVEYLLTLPVQGGSKPQKLKYILEAKTKNLTVIEAMVVAQIKKAVNGDTKAFNALLDTYEKQQLEIWRQKQRDDFAPGQDNEPDPITKSIMNHVNSKEEED